MKRERARSGTGILFEEGNRARVMTYSEFREEYIGRYDGIA